MVFKKIITFKVHSSVFLGIHIKSYKCLPRTQLTDLFLGGLTFGFVGEVIQNMDHLNSRIDILK